MKVDVLQLSASILNASDEPHLLPFGAAVPSAELFPTDRIRKALSSHLRASGSSIGRYSFAPGSIFLRTEVARRAIHWNCRLDPGNIVITNGCVEAVGLALKAVTKPGDIVAIESPGYYGFFQMLEMLNLRAIEIPSGMPNGMSVDLLAEALESHDIRACLISTTVSNPSGATMSMADKRRLVELLSDRGIPLIEDATFADLHFDGPTPAAKSFDTKGNVLLCASLTKTVAPGLRIGWIEGGKYAEQIAFLKRVTSISQPELIEVGLAKYLAEGGVDRHLRTLRTRLGDQVDRHMFAISQHLPDEVRFHRPSGGFLLWLQWPAGVDVLKLHRLALGVGIGLAPGILFSVSGHFRSHMRINCGQVWNPTIDGAYSKLSELSKLS